MSTTDRRQYVRGRKRLPASGMDVQVISLSRNSARKRPCSPASNTPFGAVLFIDGDASIRPADRQARRTLARRR